MVLVVPRRLGTPRLGTPRLATPRFPATRGHSVLRQHGSPIFKRSVAAHVTPSSGGLLTVPHHRVGPYREGSVLAHRSARAVSEPPIRAAVYRSFRSGPPQRHIHHADDIEAEYASAMCDLTLRSTTAAAQEADDLYDQSRSRDRALLVCADAAVANASVRPVASRRIASRTIATSSPNTQVDPETDYISPLYPEYDIEERSMEGSVQRKAPPSTKPGSKLGSRAIGARARVNLKRGQLTNRGSPAPGRAAVRTRAKTVGPEVLAPPMTRAMSLPPVPAVPRRTKRHVEPVTDKVSRYDNILIHFAPAPIEKGERYQRKAISRGAREGAPYGNSVKGRASAIALNKGRKFRPLRDFKTPLHPLYFDERESGEVKSLAPGQRTHVVSTKATRNYPAVRKAETPAILIISEPRTLIRSKKHMFSSAPPPKAALLAPTIEIDSWRRKTPKSNYGAAKMRELDLISRESASAGLHASSPGAGGEKQSKVSEKRREIRKAICKGRRDPTYFF